MPRRKPIPIADRARIQLENRHAGWTDFIAEYEPYCEKYPHDTWARGQLDYARKEVKRIAALLALDDNRKSRPV